MENIEKLRLICIDKIFKMREKNSLFSLRAFARYSDIHVSGLSGFLNYKRPLTESMACKLCLYLNLDSSFCSLVLTEINLRKNKNGQYNSEKMSKIEREYHLINSSDLVIFKEWHYFAILSLLETTDYRFDIPWIAKRLGITEKKVEKAMIELKKHNFVTEDGIGTGKQFKTSTGIPNNVIRKLNLENIDKIKEAILNIPMEIRDISSIVMAIDPKKIDEARIKIKNFRRELCNFLESDSRSEVYMFSMQLIPLTKDRI